MSQTWRPLRFLTAILSISSLHLVQAGPGSSHAPLTDDGALSGALLVPRAGDGGVGDSVKWTEWTSGDGTSSGKDSDGIWYIKDAVNSYIAKYPDPNDRVGIFWAGGSATQDDFDNIDEFIESYTDDKGRKFLDIFDINAMTAMGLSESNKDGKWWRAINRASKALAASANGGTAYVYLNANNCRNLFSPPSQNPQDSDPDHGGQATNGEIWYYAELPTLMRNLNVNKIVTFYKTKREPGKPPKFVQTTQWDVSANPDKPRDFLKDIAMDATPIVLPAEAGRPPLKRDAASAVSAPAAYQIGLFDVKTISVSGLTTDSATTCTATSASVVITTTVPIWSCTSCPTAYNAIFVSPVSIGGPVGVPSPPPGYQPLSVGPDMKVTPVSLSTTSFSAAGTSMVNSYSETYRYPRPSATSQPSAGLPSSTASGPSAGRPVPSVGSSLYYPSVFPSGGSSSQPSGFATNLGSSTASLTSYIGTGTVAPTSPSQSSIVTSKRTGSASDGGRVSGTLPPSSIIGTGNTRPPLSTSGSTSVGITGTGSTNPPISTGGSNSTAAVGTGSTRLPLTTGASSQQSQPNSQSQSGSQSQSDSQGQSSASLSSASQSSGLSRSSSVNAAPSSTVIATSGSSGLTSETVPVTPSSSATSPGPFPSSTASTTGSLGSQTTPPTTAGPSATLLPTGTQASSSASALSTNIVVMAPIWQDFIDHPTKDKGDDLIIKIEGLEKLAEDFAKKIGPPPSGSDKDCSVSTNLIKDIFNAAKCLTDNLNKVKDDIKKAIEDNFDDITKVKAELENITNLEEALKEDSEDHNNHSSNSNTESQGSSAQSSSQSSSSASCTSMVTASDCSAICTGVTTVVGSNSAFSKQGCSTTCFSTFSACSATNSITTVSTASAVKACPWGGATSMPPDSVPAGPFATAWFDYGISCAGSNCGFVSASGSGGGTVNGSAPVTGSASSTANSAPSSNTASATSSSGTPPSTSAPASSGSSASSNAPSSISTPSPTSPPSLTSTSAPSTTASDTPSCVASSTLPTGVPQSGAQEKITGWCSGELNLFKPDVGCDEKTHEGFYLSNTCGLKVPSYTQQYYFSGVTMYLSVALAEGTDNYVADSSTCLNAMDTILNGCPPTSGDPLMKYGGTYTTDDGSGGKAVWQIEIKDDGGSGTAPPPSSTPPPPPPSTTPPPPPPSSTPPPSQPCKKGGMYSSGCGDNCGTNGTCKSGSAGYPSPQLYYYCDCP